MPSRGRSSTGGSLAWRRHSPCLLPRTAELGHDTLSDSLGSCARFSLLWLGAIALRRGDWRFALGSGLAAGLGYLARPEVILVPLAIGLTWLIGLFRDSRTRTVAAGPQLAILLLSTMAVIGSYAVVKGEISEKLAFRYSAWLGPRSRRLRLARTSGSPRARQPPLGLLSQGRDRPDPDSQLAICRAPDRRQVVGRAVLAVRGHDRLGHRPPAVYPRPLPGSRSETTARLNAGCCWFSRPYTAWPCKA